MVIFPFSRAMRVSANDKDIKNGVNLYQQNPGAGPLSSRAVNACAHSFWDKNDPRDPLAARTADRSRVRVRLPPYPNGTWRAVESECTRSAQRWHPHLPRLRAPFRAPPAQPDRARHHTPALTLRPETEGRQGG